MKMKQCIEFAHFACRKGSVREIRLHRLATVASAAKVRYLRAPTLIDQSTSTINVPSYSNSEYPNIIVNPS
jgi:hypothetical protein